MPRPKLRTSQLRDRVLDAAMTTLADEGVAGFTTRRVAREAATSVPAVYELFGDKAGLVRELFFEGFRHLRQRLDDRHRADDPRADLIEVFGALRAFVRDNPVLAQLMFTRPFVDFDPGPAERAAGQAVRELFVGRVRRCVEAGRLAGDETDIAHALLALAQGLAAQESAGWLGTSKRSRDRRWALAFESMLDGLAPRSGPGAARPAVRPVRAGAGPGASPRAPGRSGPRG